MSSFYRTLCVLLVLTLPGLLGGCHRASYQFQASTGAEPSEAVKSPVPIIVDAEPGDTRAAMWPKKNVPPTAFLKKALRRPKGAIAAQVPVQTLSKLNGRKVSKPFPTATSSPEPVLPSQRSKGLAIVLAVLLGFFGAHLFYLGYRKRAIFYLVITLAAVALLFFAVPLGAAIGGSSGLGSALLAASIIVISLGAILGVYFNALHDVIRIATDRI